MGLFDILANIFGVDNTRKRQEQYIHSSSIPRGKFQTPPQAGKQPTRQEETSSPSMYRRTHYRPPTMPPKTAERLEHIASAYATLHASFSEIDDVYDSSTLDHRIDQMDKTMRNVFQQDDETHHTFSAYGGIEYLKQIAKIHCANQSVEQKKSALAKLDQEIRKECAINIGYWLVDQDDPGEYSSKVMFLRGNQYLQQRGL